jgi:hypothetical protein
LIPVDATQCRLTPFEALRYVSAYQYRKQFVFR